MGWRHAAQEFPITANLSARRRGSAFGFASALLLCHNETVVRCKLPILELIQEDTTNQGRIDLTLKLDRAIELSSYNRNLIGWQVERVEG